MRGCYNTGVRRPEPATALREMAKVARLTDGSSNWVFFADGDTVKVTTLTLSRIDSVQELTLDKGRELYKFVKRFNPNAKQGFTPLQRELKSLRLTTENQVRAYDNNRRETLGEEAWAEDSSTWPEFYEQGYMDVYYRAGERAKTLSWLS